MTMGMVLPLHDICAAHASRCLQVLAQHQMSCTGLELSTPTHIYCSCIWHRRAVSLSMPRMLCITLPRVTLV
jgi:hypothetical protein